MAPTAVAQSTARTLKIEDIEVGHRYVEVTAPKFEDRWVVASVERMESTCQVLRDLGNGTAEWTNLNLVKVTYRSGQTITHEVGTDIYVDCDYLA